VLASFAEVSTSLSAVCARDDILGRLTALGDMVAACERGMASFVAAKCVDFPRLYLAPAPAVFALFAALPSLSNSGTFEVREPPRCCRCRYSSVSHLTRVLIVHIAHYRWRGRAADWIDVVRRCRALLLSQAPIPPWFGGAAPGERQESMKRLPVGLSRTDSTRSSRPSRGTEAAAVRPNPLCPCYSVACTRPSLLCGYR
jgi:hypothetical protein